MKAIVTLTPVLCLLAALPALAETPQPRLTAALSGDWNGDGNPDAVLLYAHEYGMSDLVVMLGDGYQGLQPAIHLPEVVFSGPMGGQSPGLEARSASSFAILSEQTGVGREPWQQAITIAFRQGELRVAGYDFLFYDRLDPSRNGHCSVNLLTGDFTLRYGPGNEAPVTETAGRGDERAFPLSELTEIWQPAACAPLFQ